MIHFFLAAQGLHFNELCNFLIGNYLLFVNAFVQVYPVSLQHV